MRLFKQTAFALTCLVSGLIAGDGQAATLNVSAQSPYGAVFSDTNGRNAWYIGASYTLAGQSRNNVVAGVFRLTGVDAANNSIHNFMAFCMSPLSWLRLPLDYEVGNELSQTSVNRLSALANGAWDQISNSRTAGAFQLAVWEIVSESGRLNLNSGAFVLTNSSSASARQLAQSWLRKVENGVFESDPYSITTLEADNTQDLLTRDLPDYVAAVPLPAGFGLLGMALAGLLGIRRVRHI